jgi:hypothetical protein
MAKLILQIAQDEVEISLSDKKAQAVLDAIFFERHSQETEHPQAEKMFWLLDSYIRNHLTRGASRKGNRERREKMRELRQQRRELREDAPKFE